MKNELTVAKRGTDRRKSVEEIEQPKATQGKAKNNAVASAMAEWMTEYCGDFHNMMVTYFKYVQKYGPLSAKEKKVWDEQMTGYINYHLTVKNNPKHRFPKPTIWPRMMIQGVRGPAPIIDLVDQDSKDSPPSPMPPLPQGTPPRPPPPKEPQTSSLPSKTKPRPTPLKKVLEPLPQMKPP